MEYNIVTRVLPVGVIIIIIITRNLLAGHSHPSPLAVKKKNKKIDYIRTKGTTQEVN